ncbi:MAG: FHA domain-containing protein [Anaerolineales bacterium]
MQICQNCGYDNREGLLFCEKCGVALGMVSVSTKQLNEEDDNLAAGSQYLADDHVMLLHFVGYEDPVAIKLDNELVLGREGADNGFNLSSFDAANHGVSRRHAMFIREDNQVFIRDLQSTNHTYLNGSRLVEDRDYAIRDGDEITLGRLTFKLFFK